MVVDRDRILDKMRALVPRRYEDETLIFERSVGRAFGGFLRAQLILAVIQALLVAIVGVIFGIPFLFLVAVISSLLMLIPFFGPPLALIPPVVAALIYTGGFIPVTLILLIVQTVLVNWLQPLLMRGAHAGGPTAYSQPAPPRRSPIAPPRSWCRALGGRRCARRRRRRDRAAARAGPRGRRSGCRSRSSCRETARRHPTTS